MKKFDYLINFEGNHSFFNRQWTWYSGLIIDQSDVIALNTNLNNLSILWKILIENIWCVITGNIILETWSLTSEFHKGIPIDYRIETKNTEDHPSNFIWNISYFGSDDSLLLAKLSLPGWMFNPIKE